MPRWLSIDISIASQLPLRSIHINTSLVSLSRARHNTNSSVLRAPLFPVDDIHLGSPLFFRGYDYSSSPPQTAVLWEKLTVSVISSRLERWRKDSRRFCETSQIIDASVFICVFKSEKGSSRLIMLWWSKIAVVQGTPAWDVKREITFQGGQTVQFTGGYHVRIYPI